MEVTITKDAMGTHIDWQHEGVTPKMIDWFWSNMDKGMLLWHPEEHEPLVWAVPPKHGNPLGAVHIAPQTWSDGARMELYIRFERFEDLSEDLKSYVVYDHCVIAGGLGFGPESLSNPEPFGYRIHQWQKTDYGVVGKSNAIHGKKILTPEDGMVWAKHCTREIGNWGVFLPQLYNLYRVVKNARYNPYTDLSVEGRGKDLRYKYIQ